MGRFGIFMGAAMIVALLAGSAVEAQSLSGLAGQLLGGQPAGGSQSATPPSGGQSPTSDLSGVAGSLLGQAMPSVSSAGPDNIAGVLSYCVQNSLVSNNGAASVLGNLTGRGGMTSSSGFLEGKKGNLQTGGGSLFSLSSLEDQLKSKLCDMVLERAKSLL